MCIFPNTANVTQIAVAVDKNMSAIEHKMGWYLLKIKSKIKSTASMEIVEMAAISRDAFEELL